MQNKLNLSNVEIVSINTHAPMESIKAIEYSCRNITFSKKKLFSDIPLKVNDIEHIFIPKFTTRVQYSQFCIKEMYKYIESDFVLVIHDDGFVINPHLWNDDFLNYDYIGAPWPYDVNNPTYGRVGNGGFSIRSKKLLSTIKDLDIDEYVSNNDLNEDWLIGVTKKDVLENMGIRIAPVELAMQFSLELPIQECEYNLENTFGFHSKRSQQHINKIGLLNQVIL